MPIDWKPDIPLAAFIAYRKENPKQNEARLPTILAMGSNGIVRVQQSTDVLSRPLYTQGEKKNLTYQVEGTLEMQRLILQRLARLENSTRGLDSDAQSNFVGEKQKSRVSDVVFDLNNEKKEFESALRTIWIK
jgi:hypothetical protein